MNLQTSPLVPKGSGSTPTNSGAFTSVGTSQAETSERPHKTEEMKRLPCSTDSGQAVCNEDEGAMGETLAPATKVPFEVLAAIFQACIPDIASLSTVCSGVSSRRHPSIVLSRVCRSWRATALNSPRLWSELLIAIPTYTEPSRESGAEWLRKKEQLRRAVDTWAQRSASALLTLRVISNATFFWSGQGGDRERAVSGDLVGAIKRTSPRWRGISFSLAVGSHLEAAMLALLQVAPTSLPQLKTVDLRVLSEASGMDSQLHHTLQYMLNNPTSLLSTPSIRSLKLHGMWGDTSFPSATKNWPPLMTLDVDCFQPHEITPTQSVHQLLRLLSCLPTLVSVSFFVQGRGTANDQIPPWTAATPNAPVLQSLTLKGAQVPKGFAKSIHMPALRDLHLQFTSLIPEGVDSGIVECLVHLGAQLQSLTFSPDAVNRHALVKIYESLPAVENLILCPQGSESHFRCSSERPGVDCYAIAELNEVTSKDVRHSALESARNAPGSEDRDLQTLRCPRLRNLSLQATGDRYADDAVEQALVDLIARRRPRYTANGSIDQGVRLEEVKVHFRRASGEETPDVGAELGDWGVDLDGFVLKLVYP